MFETLLLTGCIVAAIVIAILSGRRKQKQFFDTLDQD